MVFHFVSPPQSYANLNNRIDSLTTETAASSNATPKFVYTHLNMPHHPYLFDKNGKEVPGKLLTDNYKFNKTAFLEYLSYTNGKLLELIDQIRKNANKPPVIILMSDHGFRQFPETGFNKYHFINLNAVYFPDENYFSFYDGMTNVNQFRVILNSLFHQNLSLLKDSSSFLWEK